MESPLVLPMKQTQTWLDIHIRKEISTNKSTQAQQLKHTDKDKYTHSNTHKYTHTQTHTHTHTHTHTYILTI